MSDIKAPLHTNILETSAHSSFTSTYFCMCSCTKLHRERTN